MKSPTNRKAAILLSVLSVLILAAGVTSCTSQMGSTAADTHAAKLQQQVPDQAGVTKETEKADTRGMTFNKVSLSDTEQVEETTPHSIARSFATPISRWKSLPPPTRNKRSSRSLKHTAVSSSPQKQNKETRRNRPNVRSISNSSCVFRKTSSVSHSIRFAPSQTIFPKRRSRAWTSRKSSSISKPASKRKRRSKRSFCKS